MGVAIIIFFISLKISRKALILISAVLSLVCVGIVIYSIEAVGGWKDIEILFVTVSGFLGILVGTISGVIIEGSFRKFCCFCV
nr:YesK family protein [Oceanobacillus massiliensis]